MRPKAVPAVSSLDDLKSTGVYCCLGDNSAIAMPANLSIEDGFREPAHQAGSSTSRDMMPGELPYSRQP